MIDYTLEIERPESSLARVSVEIGGLRGDSVDFILPSWSPGSYLIRDYVKNVVSAAALDSSGENLPCVKIEKSRWRVTPGKSRSCRFVYEVYCHEYGVQSSFIDDSHASLHGPSLFAYPAGMEKEKCVLRLKFPGAWKKISTGLDRAENSPDIFEAPDYDTLLDCPIEIGNQAVHTFEVRGVPHHLAIYGEGNFDAKALTEDTRKIVEAAMTVFDHVPYSHYTFILQLLAGDGGGGLEHLNSTLLQTNRWKFRPEEEYRKKLSLISHEFFHLWNVKRLAPRPLVSFDYTKENYTDMLWVAEGITSYYEDLILLRAGLYTPQQYFDAILSDYKGYLDSPGHSVQSACESSFDAWVKHYRPGEAMRNLTVSYYRIGALLGLALDLLIRKASGGRASLDHALRALYAETYLKSRKGYTLDDFKSACENAAGASLKDFFSKHVEGREHYDLGEFLAHAGLRLTEKPDKANPHPGFLGIEWRVSDGKIFVSSVAWGEPAAAAGIIPGDEIVGWNGYRAHQETLSERIRECKPGTSHKMQIFRQDRLKEIEVKLGEKRKEWRIEPAHDAGAEAQELMRGWLGTMSLKEEESAAAKTPA